MSDDLLNNEPLNLDMPLEEAMRTQRAVRRLKPDAVDDRVILHLIELALRAPTGSNAQNWAFIVVRDRKLVREIGALNRTAWWLYSRLGRWLMRQDEKMKRTIDAVRYQVDHFDETPVIVVACLRGRAPLLGHIRVASYYASIYPAVQNLLLAARAANLGATLITLPMWNVRRLKRILALPGHVTPCALVPMGWPLGRYGPTTRRPVGEVVHLDRYGYQPFRKGSAEGEHPGQG